MENLIKALQIFLKYHVGNGVMFCEHDTFMVFIDPTNVLRSDIKELESLGFEPDYVSGIFQSSLK